MKSLRDATMKKNSPHYLINNKLKFNKMANKRDMTPSQRRRAKRDAAILIAWMVDVEKKGRPKSVVADELCGKYGVCKTTIYNIVKNGR